MCLRKNREADTHYANWSMRGESWAVNPDDVAYVSSAAQTSNKRGMRCVRTPSHFSVNPDDGDPGKRVFLSDAAPMGWVRGVGDTGVSWTRIMMPFIRCNRNRICEEDFRGPPAQHKEDEDWIRRRMARRIGDGADLFDDARATLLMRDACVCISESL